MPIKRILICLFFIFGMTGNLSVSAWIVPWTIQKASETSQALQCSSTDSWEYKTSYTCESTWACQQYKSSRSSACSCQTYGTKDSTQCATTKDGSETIDSCPSWTTPVWSQCEATEKRDPICDNDRQFIDNWDEWDHCREYVNAKSTPTCPSGSMLNTSTNKCESSSWFTWDIPDGYIDFDAIAEVSQCDSAWSFTHWTFKEWTCSNKDTNNFTLCSSRCIGDPWSERDPFSDNYYCRTFNQSCEWNLTESEPSYCEDWYTYSSILNTCYKNWQVRCEYGQYDHALNKCVRDVSHDMSCPEWYRLDSANNQCIIQVCDTYEQETDYNTCVTYNECRDSSHGCEIEQKAPSFTTSTFKNKIGSKANPALKDLYTLPTDYQYYKNEWLNSCKVSVTGTNHDGTATSVTSKCWYNDSVYYPDGLWDGTCSAGSYTNYIISSYDQYGRIQTSTPTWTKNSCIVEWRVAVTDAQWPEITIETKNFTNDETKWCNLNKYKGLDWFSTYGDSKSPTTIGCEYYKKLSSFTWNNPDLISDLKITISDTSAISKVNVELWICSANISLTNDLSKLVTNGNGTKDEVKNLVLHGHKSSTYAGQSIESLKKLFNVSRLDDCLDNGRNYIKVTAKDNARNPSNVLELDSNATIFSTQTTKFINIDNIGVSFGTDSSAPSSSTSWYDKTVSGKFVFQDYAEYGDPICKAYEKWEAHTCTGKPNNSYWVSPSGVNPATWQHNIYTCDGEPLSVNGCDWVCDIWFEKKDGTCVPIETKTTCWTLGISRLGHDTKLCSYTPIYTWRTKADTVCNGSFYLQSSVCKDQYGHLASKDMCGEPEPPSTVPCSLWNKQSFNIGRDKIWETTKTIWK